MTSNDANGFAEPANPSSYRRDAASGTGPTEADDDARGVEATARWAQIERAWWALVLGAMLVFSAFPIANLILGLSTKDYGLWYQVGRAVRQGLDVYPRPETGRLFPFMYPPSAAAMLAWVSLLGSTGSLLALVLVNSAAWLACIKLSVWLAMGPGAKRHPLVVILPSLSMIVLIHNIYLLGQPNLVLLALVLGAFACLRLGRAVAAGTLVATAAAIKAFPILILGYLVYRRMWKASAATIVALAAWLLVAPLPFRSPAQAVDDLIVWSQGMVFTYNTYGIAQRPLRSYSYKNQSIMALAHRLLRDVPADGESILSRKARADYSAARPGKGLPPVEPTTDLFLFLKPHDQQPPATAPMVEKRADRQNAGVGAAPTPVTDRAPQRAVHWEDAVRGAQVALRNAWRVNVVSLSFRAVTGITLLAILAICLLVAIVLPKADRRTRQTDALEFALVTLLTVMFSPLSFNYAYVWLIYPTTLGLSLVMCEPASAPWHRLKVAWIAAVFIVPALAVPLPLIAQAYGNLFVPALLLVIGLCAMLRAAGRPGRIRRLAAPAHLVPRRQTQSSSADPFIVPA
jgi:alpha-1,2-mannosyltransferase